MSTYRVVVAWSESEAYTVEADNSDDAGDAAIERAQDEHPFADDYEVVFEPEALADPEGGETK